MTNVQNKKKSWYVTIVSPSFLSSEGLFPPKKRAAADSIVSHALSIAHVFLSGNYNMLFSINHNRVTFLMCRLTFIYFSPSPPHKLKLIVQTTFRQKEM